MKKINLTSNEQLELTKLKKNYQSEHKVFRRLKCIELRSKGIKPKNIINLLDISADSITDWCNLYLEKGLQGLCEFDYDGRKISEFEPYKDEIMQMIKSKIYSTYAELYYDFSKKYAIKNKQDALRKYCKKNGIGVTKSAI